MTNEVIDMIQYMIDFESKMIRRSVSGILLGMLAGIIFLIIATKYQCKKRKITKNQLRLILQFCLISICLISITGLIHSEGKRWKRVTALRTDLRNLEIHSSIGTVEDIFSYQKGGNAAIIEGQEYYIMPKIGYMKPGVEFKINYLFVSKFIVSFEVAKDDPSPKTAGVSEDMLWRFSDGAFEPVHDIYMVNDLAYQYIRNYYETFGGEYDEYNRDASWRIYSYYIKSNETYRCNLESKNQKISLIIDAETGKPVYFWSVELEEIVN